MSVERNTPTTSGILTIKDEPGTRIRSDRYNETVWAELHVSGAQGVRFLSQLIEEATALRDELRAVVG